MGVTIRNIEKKFEIWDNSPDAMNKGIRKLVHIMLYNEQKYFLFQEVCS